MTKAIIDLLFWRYALLAEWMWTRSEANILNPTPGMSRER